MNKGLMYPVILANVVGALYGFVFYYGDALKSTSPVFAVFVPDCPLYALLFAVVMYLLISKKRNDLFFFIVFVGALKYGFWTMFVLVKYSDYYFTQDSILYSILFVSHMGLFLEPVLLLGKIRFKRSYLAPAFVWFLVNDIVDYVAGTHPPLPKEAVGYMFSATVVMSVVFTLIAYLLLEVVVAHAKRR